MNHYSDRLDGLGFDAWHIVQTGSVTHPAFYHIVSGCSFPAVKAAGE
jgi:hypothetical protein